MIKIIAAGSIKERFFRDAVNEYLKRLSAYDRVCVVEIKDEGSDAQTAAKEAKSILHNIKDTDYVITLEIEGEKRSSAGFAKMIDDLRQSRRSDIIFVIGGSVGLDVSVLERADANISFSDMTFPHQLMRVILLEQIYRAFKIIRNEPYHK